MHSEQICEYSKQPLCPNCKGAVYECDPTKNTPCKKNSCGDCIYTSQAEYAKNAQPLCRRKLIEKIKAGAAKRYAKAQNEHNKKMIGKRLNALLAVKDLKQKDIADLLGVTENTVSYYVTGARCPNTDRIIAIAKNWNISADYLLGLSDVMSTENRKLRLDVTNIPELKELLEQAENDMNQLNGTMQKLRNFHLEVDVLVKRK